jgi:hypothetical protein
MENKQYLIVASIVLIGILIGSIGLVYVLLPKPSASPIIATNQSPENLAPEVHLYKKRGGGGLTLTWTNLPAGTTKVNIYRSPRGGAEVWTKWKTITIDPNQHGGGSIDILTTDNVSLFTFYTEATYTPPPGSSSSTSGTGGNGPGDGTGGGEIILWQSSSTFAEPPPVIPPITQNPTSTTTGGGQGGGQGSTSTATSSDPGTQNLGPTASSTTGGGAPSSTGSGSGTGSGNGTGGSPDGNYYYTPSGAISGSGTSTHGNFWVEHVNQSIEIGWQGISSDTDTAIVYRATDEGGPWTELLRQANTPTNYSIRLLDNTLSTPHWYKMEAKDGVSTIATYGPTYLPAIE